MSRDRARRLAVLVVVVLVATSTMVVGVGAGAAQTADDDDDEPVEAADEVYVKDNGDAVLVYRNDSNGTNTEYGIDVGSNVFYALVEAPVEEDTGVRADLTSVVTEDRFTSNGSLTVPRPDEVDEFSLDASGRTTNDTNRFDADASATINNSELDEDMQVARIVQSASASGNLSTTPTRFRTATEFEATLLQSVGPERHERFTLTEDDGDYTVDVARDYVVSDFQVDNYDTESEARQTLQAQFGATAQQLGGTAAVTIQSYSFDADTNRLDIEYTVEYTGVEEGLAETIAGQIAASEDIDLNESQNETFKTRFQRLNIDEASVRVDQVGTEVSGSFRLDLRNYDEWVRAAITLGEASPSTEEADLDALRAQLEAQEEANLQQRFEWTASLEQPDDQRTAISAGLQYRTTNWGEYVDALGTRDASSVDREFDLTATTQGDEITAEGSIEVESQELVRRAASRAIEGDDPEASRFAEALRNADLEKARVDVSADGSTVRFEAGAKFDNLSAVRDALVETSDVPRFTSIVGRTEGDTVESYVYIEDAVESGATESDVRALPYADSETTVNLPGEWDREFPSVDTQRAADFLGVSLEPGDGTEGATVALRPANSQVESNGTVTYDVVVSGIDSGVGSYDLVANSSDASRARIVSVRNRIGGQSQSSVTSDGLGVELAAFGGGTADTGPVTVATITLRGDATGDVNVPLTVTSLSDESGTQYTVSSTSGANLTVVDEVVAPDVTGDGNPARDPDNDDLYEDVNGDGDVTPGDATVLFNAVFEGNPAVTDNVSLFDFNGDNNVTPGDATVLFNEIFG